MMARRRDEIDRICTELGRLLDQAVEPPWPWGEWAAGRFTATVIELPECQSKVLVEFRSHFESDFHGAKTWTTRTLTVFRDDHCLLLRAHGVTGGLNEHDGGGVADSRIDQVTEYWKLEYAAYGEASREKLWSILSGLSGHFENAIIDGRRR